MIAPEPSLAIQFVLVWILPYVAYFGGICIGHKTLRGSESPTLLNQLLLGIPIGLMAVTPFLGALHQTISTHILTYILFLGIIIEHSVMFHEKAIKRLQEIRSPG